MPFCFSVRFSLPVTNLNGSSDLVALEDQADEGGYVKILAILTLQPHSLLVFPRDTIIKLNICEMMKICKYDVFKKLCLKFSVQRCKGVQASRVFEQCLAFNKNTWSKAKDGQTLHDCTFYGTT
jgi:hypothetical protein